MPASSYIRMFRTIFYTLLSIVCIVFIRMVIGIIMKGFSAALNESAPVPEQRQGAPQGGELKRDPVCGTFVAAATSLKRLAGGETYYYCSPACRDKHRA